MPSTNLSKTGYLGNLAWMCLFSIGIEHHIFLLFLILIYDSFLRNPSQSYRHLSQKQLLLFLVSLHRLPILLSLTAFFRIAFNQLIAFVGYPRSVAISFMA
ncbi:uncharacterized protein BO80DRAFT_51957 [Aspergillus ibericus CBS 121593]|uniref:Uncharacterized protein n=1 Tax=Aspergillus ibericus CBS 121593 TaxID=1448316 RepID=A0A395H410_9EURO|nr:hypothetical protein BO80DRAFT_51957 [Aspergillus ibericus CBS 121593]RAL01598.1 hypothetical protein BO80DRAFT_51957 [Aspergillus ibericus CBS 121593]